MKIVYICKMNGEEVFCTSSFSDALVWSSVYILHFPDSDLTIHLSLC